MQVSHLVSRSTKNFGKTKFSYAKSCTSYLVFMIQKKKLLQIICVLTIGAHESELSVVGTFGSVLEYLVL